MSITADMSSNLVLEGDTVVSPPDLTLQLERRESKALSISSLSNESQNSVAKAVATEACRDVERELEAIETRLSAFQGRRLRNDSESTSQNAVAPLQSTIEDKSDKDEHASTASNASSQIFSKLSKAQQEAGAVADQVASTLMKCDQLLQRVKYGVHGNEVFELGVKQDN
ncbi:Chemotaxis protein [Phytophthora palmivora]|uniref:Chemotaxis protein n=1 Tax=Phytophthora palmivora TaxID=4796 RepID=A0A2P4X9Y7_9STRA|nr:Chemotaxis protein [Phytophthora palmivora]